MPQKSRILESLKGRNGIIFITGTDTGVGKTILTGFLIAFLRQNGLHALGMKPFCSGGRDDALFLNALQDNELPVDIVNPFFFKPPVTPLVGAWETGVRVSFTDAVQSIRNVKDRCQWLVVEGVGGIMSPLGEWFSSVELIRELESPTIVVGGNKLGVLNHMLLTINVLERCCKVPFQPVLRGTGGEDKSSATNKKVIESFFLHGRVVEIPFFGTHSLDVEGVRKNAKKIAFALATAMAFDNI
ncbi:MAG: dethiobiotin synthase [Verrucomicrobia bacterium]|nr:dethiobiotin synthase [Verrucomicrobiota bacterium]MCF7707315.1 dethiobiotin synthase [Verrucomicrobiota bacterium]